MAYKGVVQLIGQIVGGGDTSETAPQVVWAASLNSTTVEVTFDMDMSNAGLTTAGNYVFAGPTAITASVVTKINQTHVHVTITGEMRTGVDNYTVTVSGVQSAHSVPIDTEYDTETFNGVGIAPEVSSAEATDGFIVNVQFSEELTDDGSADNLLAYTIEGAPGVNVLSAGFGPGNDNVNLAVSEMLEGADYTVVVEPGLVPLELHMWHGQGTPPVPSDISKTVRGDFSGDTGTLLSYTITESETYWIVKPDTVDDTFLIEAASGASSPDVMVLSGTGYQVCDAVTSSRRITDLAGNPLDPAHVTADFEGVGLKPQVFGAAAIDATHIEVYFDDFMQETVAIETAARYAIAGPTVVTVVSATLQLDTSIVVLEVTGEMHTGTGNYTVTVSPVTGILCIVGNELDPAHNSTVFDGIGVLPRVTAATVIDPSTVRVTFNEDMTNDVQLLNHLNYIVDDKQYVGGADLGLIKSGAYSLVRSYVNPGHDITLKGLHGYRENELDKIVVVGEDWIGAPLWSDTIICEHFNGVTWDQPFPHGEDGWMQCLSAYSPTDMWMGGNFVTIGSEGPDPDWYACIFHFNGTAWSLHHVFPYAYAHIDKIIAVSPTCVWATATMPGNAGCAVFRWNGTTWQNMGFPTDTDICIFSMCGNSVDRMWFGGIHFGSPNTARVWEWDVDHWDEVLTGVVTGEVNSMVYLGDGELWAAGYPSSLYHFASSVWTKVDVPVSNLWLMSAFAALPYNNDVCFTAHDGGWTNRYILRWNGAEVEVAYQESGSEKGFLSIKPKPGVTSLIPSAAVRFDARNVDLTVNEMRTGADYSVMVNTRITDDPALNPVDYLHNYADFEGVGVAPQVDPTAVRAGLTHVHVFFSEFMATTTAIENPARYTIDGPTPLVVTNAELYESFPDQYVILTITGEMLTGGAYTVTVDPVTDIRDAIGNELDPGYVEAAFEGLGIKPKVSAATGALAYVDVDFDEEMGGPELEDADNYVITGPTTITSVTATIQSTTRVRVATSGEFRTWQTAGDEYTVQVSNVKDNEGNLIDPDFDTAEFHGVGVSPQLSSAEAILGGLTATFSEAMKDNADLRTAGNYEITGPTSVTVFAAAPVVGHPDQVLLTLSGEMFPGIANYTLTVNTVVVDLAGNPLDPAADHVTFDGKGVGPQVLPDAVVWSSTEVQIAFNKTIDQATAEDEGNYEIIGGSPVGPLAVTLAEKLNATTVRLTTAAQQGGELYTITVSGVEDESGIPVDPDYDTATFTGAGDSPPFIEFLSLDEATNADTRTELAVHIYDDSFEFAGVRKSLIWIRMTYTIDGNSTTAYGVYGGKLQAGFVGEVLGDPLAATGLTYYLHPTNGWPVGAEVLVEVYATDIEGSVNYKTTSFTVGTSACFEDDLPAILALETKLLSSLAPFANADKLRQLLLRCCTESDIRQVQARTVMYLAAMTDLKAILATADFDFSQVKDVLLCGRNSTMDIYQKMQPYIGVANSAIDDMNSFTLEGKALLRKYLSSNSPIYVVNAIALVVVLTAMLEI